MPSQFGSYHPSTTIASAPDLYLDAGNSSSYLGSGTNWTDLSGNGINGVLVNGPVYNNSNNGHFVFDGINDYVSFSTNLPSTNNLTYEAWVNPSELNSSQFYALLNHDGWTSGYVHFQFLGNTLQFALNDKNDKYAEFTFSTNNWYHIAAVYSRSNQRVSFYVNGSWTNNEFYTGNNQPSVASTTLKLGTWNTNSRFFKGKIGLVRVYHRTLSSAELLNNFNVSRPRFGL
jgi:hypothetical protein